MRGNVSKARGAEMAAFEAEIHKEYLENKKFRDNMGANVYLKNNDVVGENTKTVSVSMGDTETVSFKLSGVGTDGIYDSALFQIEEKDVSYVITFEKNPNNGNAVTAWADTHPMTFALDENNSANIVLSEYEKKITAIEIMNGTEDNTVTVAIKRNQVYVSADINEKSIGENHLNEELAEKLNTKPTYTADEVGAIPQDAANSQSGTIALFYDGVRKVVEAYVKEGSINKDHVTDEIITEDDIATTDKAGIVQLFHSGGLQMLPFSANDFRLATNQATKQQIETKGDMYRPITTDVFDVALVAGTHQEMSDTYDPELFYICNTMEGKQGQLPVSYDAVKNYVDSQQGGGVTYGGGETDTIKTVIEDTTFETHEVEAGGTVTVYVGENDVRHDLSAANAIIARDIVGYDVDGNTVGDFGYLGVFSGTSCTIDFTQFDAKVVYYEFMSQPENIITVKKTSTDLAILAEVKDGSIQPKHLAEEYCTKAEVDGMMGVIIPFADGEAITVADNTTYIAQGEMSTLAIVYPDTEFICSLHFTLVSGGDITITLPDSDYIGGIPSFANGETWELNIKNGVVVGGKVE